MVQPLCTPGKGGKRCKGTEPFHQQKRTNTSSTRLTRFSKTRLPFRFLDLPAELRNAIYFYTFAGTSTIIVAPGRITKRHGRRTGPSALLQTNEQIRNEAYAVFVTETKWVLPNTLGSFDPVLAVHEFKRLLSPERCAIVTRVCLLEWMPKRIYEYYDYRYSPPAPRTQSDGKMLVGILKRELRDAAPRVLSEGLSVEFEGTGWRLYWSEGLEEAEEAT